MRIRRRIAVAAFAVACVALAGLGPIAAAEITQQVTIETPSDRNCAGDVNTLYWSPPAGIADLIGYRVVRSVTTTNPPTGHTQDVGREQTSLSFEVPFGITVMHVYAVTSSGVASTPFARGSVFAGQPPQPMQWEDEGASAGDQTATVPFRWPGPVKLFTTGGLTNTVRITAAPSGSTVDLQVSGDGVQAIFTGLTNGAAYTFTAVTFNACGSSAVSGSSPPYISGVAPTWERNAPPLQASQGTYVYKFAAEGDPAPTFQLADAPSWLTISPRGLLSGRPPAGTRYFFYSVVASNGVGIEWYQNTSLRSGPFTVSVFAP